MNRDLLDAKSFWPHAIPNLLDNEKLYTLSNRSEIVVLPSVLAPSLTLEMDWI